MAAEIQIRRDTLENWTDIDPVLADGEIGLEYTAVAGQYKAKIGDGVLAYSELPYWSTGGGGGGASYGDGIVPAGAVDGVNAVFTLPNAPNPALSLVLIRNGVTQSVSAGDYALAGLTITYSIPPAIGDTHVCWFRY
jgi:hypothetical protein